MDEPTPTISTTLEQLVQPRHTFQRAASATWDAVRSKPYWVDVTAAWLFYTGPYALMEWQRAGMELGEIAQNRAEGLAAHAVTMLPYRRYREWLAERCGITPESNPVRKWLVDTGAVLTIQAPLYAGMLLCSGVSAEEFCLAYPAGLGMGAALHPLFGFTVDQWRKLWGTKPTLYR